MRGTEHTNIYKKAFLLQHWDVEKGYKSNSLIYIQTLCSGYMGLKSVSMFPALPFAWVESDQACSESPDVGAFSNYLVVLFVAAAIHPD